MEAYSDMPDQRDGAQPYMTIYSMWAVSYAMVNGVEIIGTTSGRYGRVGWKLDNTDGRAKTVLDEWRSGIAIVNGRALIDAHSRLMDIIRNDF
jgi:hypothetical protein